MESKVFLDSKATKDSVEFAEFRDFLDSKDSIKYKNAWIAESRESKLGSKKFIFILHPFAMQFAQKYVIS